MKKLLKSRNLIIICSAIILSTTGSWLLIYALSTTLFMQTGSLVASSLVLFCKVIPSALAGILGGNLADRIRPKVLLLGVYCISFVITMLYLVPASLHIYWLLYLLIALRSICDHTETVGKEVSVVYFFDRDLQLRANTLINTANLVSMALASALGIYLLRFVSLNVLILVDAVTFLLSAGILIFLKEPPQQDLPVTRNGAGLSLSSVINDTKEAMREIRRNSVIKDAIAYGATLGIFLEGSRFVFHHYMGLQRFQLGPSGVSQIVSIEAVGMILGGLVTSLLATWLMRGKLKLVMLAIATSVFYSMQITSDTPYSYLFYLFWASTLYQIFDIHTINMMISACPPHVLGKVSGLWIKFFALPSISVLSLIAAIIIPITSHVFHVLLFVGVPLLIIASWEVRSFLLQRKTKKTNEGLAESAAG